MAKKEKKEPEKPKEKEKEKPKTVKPQQKESQNRSSLFDIIRDKVVDIMNEDKNESIK